MMATIPQYAEQSPNVGDILDNLQILDFTVDGKAVARHGGRVVFLDSGLPGACVRARITEIKKRIILAEAIQEHESSPHETVPWCPHFEECGACNWQHFSMQAALDWKRSHVRESLTRIGKVKDIPIQPVTSSPVLRSFRNKMTFIFGEQGGTSNLGLRKWKSHELVPIDGCGIIHPLAGKILQYTREAIAKLGLKAWKCDKVENGRSRVSGYLRYLIMRTANESAEGQPQFLVECITGTDHEALGIHNKLSNRKAVGELANDLMERFSLSGFVHTERKSLTALAQSEKLVEVVGKDHLLEQIGHISLSIPYNTFFQTNTGVARLLYEHIAREAALTGVETVWDLYCGVGGIGLFLARAAKAVHGFEISDAAVRAARHNAHILGAEHCSFHTGDISSNICLQYPAPDIIIIDPPRAGLSAQAVELLLRTPTAQKLLYVSCNVATQARDISLLSKQWHPEKGIPVDMFPYTPHVENLLVLKRSSG